MVGVPLLRGAVMRQHEPSYARLACRRAWLALGRIDQRRLTYEQVGAARGVNQLRAWPHIGRKHERRPRAALNAHRVRQDVVLHGMKRERQSADAKLAL